MMAKRSNSLASNLRSAAVILKSSGTAVAPSIHSAIIAIRVSALLRMPMPILASGLTPRSRSSPRRLCRSGGKPGDR